MAYLDPGDALRERTNAKVEYARIHLNELVALPSYSGDFFERAHQESFLFHLLSVRETLLIELNHYYETGLVDHLSLGKLREALKAQAKSSPEVWELRELEEAPNSWFSIAKRMRDHSTHLHGVRRRYYIGGEEGGAVKFMDPTGGTEPVTAHVPTQLQQWFGEMTGLVGRLRASARDATGR